MAAVPLSDTELSRSLADLPGWSVRDGKLTATFEADRAAVPALYTAVAAAEDEAHHHAEITILHGTIGFALSTHDAGDAITALDTAMATRVTALAGEHGARPADGWTGGFTASWHRRSGAGAADAHGLPAGALLRSGSRPAGAR
ncbi:4a-hydroxytetrahydrobiopterin dehydratase [Streptomyces sp. NPDC001985]|uniref:4a-hydroxytetrahydrobiopterin dehydratase n=1 Tax=Streptomyces sp. NPDC001985 TaxID=3154406 RepID=UPI003331141E